MAEQIQKTVVNLSDCSNDITVSFNAIKAILSGDDSFEAEELLAAARIVFNNDSYEIEEESIRQYLTEILSAMDEKYKAYVNKNQ